MLYPHREDKELSRELFEHPGSEYRCAPFWAWNAKLDKDELLRQIDIFKEMDMGGFHMHSRTGMATPYLSDDFMDLIKACRDHAQQKGMLAWLYDEDRWPSGAAGGIVTKDRRYSARHLRFTPQPREEQAPLARYQVTLKDGFLDHYERLSDAVSADDNTWYAYLEIVPASPWYNNETYVNTLDPNAIKRFVEVTHERYLAAVGESFGGVIPAIFTDEPQFSRKQTLGFADDKADVTLPFTDDLPDTYRAAYGEDLLDHLPELFWELPDGKVSLTRYHYHDHVAERFASAFAGTVGQWCGEHNIMMTGHLMDEPTLQSQTSSLGEAMRSYRSFQLPGIDMLCDWHEFTTAKQAQSAAHQYGRPGVLSEMYGVTNWDYDFRGHKLQGDWQAALGVTVRVPHLSWYSMGGPAKRDYPASISYQVPWYREYSLIEDYFARVNAALTRGEPDIRVAVIHPVESYWLNWGPREQTAAIREQMDQNFQNLAEWLLMGLIDFHYISESLLPELCPKGGAPLQVGKMRYDAIIVPAMQTMRSTTLERLEAFREAGGHLIFAGDIPTLVDAEPCGRVIRLAEQSEKVGMNRTSILNALEKERMLDIRDESGARTQTLIHQLRIDGENRWLFVCQGKNPVSKDMTHAHKMELRVRGSWIAEVWNAQTGEVEDIDQHVRGDVTYITRTFDAHDSLLLKLIPRTDECEARRAERAENCSPALTEVRAVSPVKIRLDEPNVLLLDQAEYALDGEDWHAREEILRLDNQIRTKLGWPLRVDHLAQPWVTANTDFGDGQHTLSLRFVIDSRIAVRGAKLALEDAQSASISLDGKAVPVVPDGWYTDKAIQTVPLPDFSAGTHELVVKYDFRRTVNPEWMYLLGDFGVTVRGDRAYITEPVRALSYGDFGPQGLPFYGGNVTYEIPCECGENGLTVEVPQYRGGLVRAYLDGLDAGAIIYAPYRLHIAAAPGRHILELKVYGNRVNSFGPVHDCDPTLTWFGPPAWMTEGRAFSYEYRLKPSGLLIAPRLYR